MENEIQQAIRDYEDALARIVLYTVREAPMPLGIKRIVSILKGTKSTFNIEHGIYGMATFGLLSAVTQAYVKDIIQCMLELRLLEIRMVSPAVNLPVVHITDEGAAFVAGVDICQVSFANRLADSDVILLDEEEQKLFDALREQRAAFAREQNLVPYLICHDNHLREMARTRPLTLEELGGISGIGHKFITNYGVRFLMTISQTREAQSRSGPETKERLTSRQKPDEPTLKAHDVEQIRQGHPNAYEPWSPNEDERLRRFYSIGMTIGELVEAFGRQPGGIRSRLKKLGLAE